MALYNLNKSIALLALKRFAAIDGCPKNISAVKMLFFQVSSAACPSSNRPLSHLEIFHNLYIERFKPSQAV